jgi:hypothetical protein
LIYAGLGITGIAAAGAAYSWVSREPEPSDTEAIQSTETASPSSELETHRGWTYPYPIEYGQTVSSIINDLYGGEGEETVSYILDNHVTVLRGGSDGPEDDDINHVWPGDMVKIYYPSPEGMSTPESEGDDENE